MVETNKNPLVITDSQKNRDNSNNAVALLVPTDVVFPGAVGTFDEFKRVLGQLPLVDVLLWACQLNMVVGTSVVEASEVTSHILKQQFGLTQFFTKEQIDRLNHYVKNNGGADRIYVFFRGQFLELIRWACIFCPNERADKKELNDPEVRELFVKAALMAGAVWSKRVYKNRLGPIDEHIETRRKKAAGAIRASLIESVNAEVSYRAAARGQALFFTHMPAEYPEFAIKFKEITDIELRDYADCWMALLGNLLPETIKENEHMRPSIQRNCWFNRESISGIIPEKASAMENLISLESQTVDELRRELWGSLQQPTEQDLENFSMLTFRKKPILLVNDLIVLIDPLFCLEKLSVGPLFHTSKRPDLLRSKREPFQSFGKAFENYCNVILDRMFGQSGSDLTRTFFPKPQNVGNKGTQAEVLDGLLLLPDGAAFFQTKAQLLKAEYFLADDSAAYHDHLLATYQTGLEQLTHSITKLESGTWKIHQQSEVQRWKIIYPILLVHDRFFEGPVEPHLLNDKFKELLCPDEYLPSGYMKKGRFTVTPLIVMTVSTLEDLESSLKHFSFGELLKDYSLSCTDRVTTLRNYILTSPYKRKCYASKFVAENAIAAYDSVLQNMFGKSKE